MTPMASQITSFTVVYWTVYSDADQRKIKAQRHCPLCGEFTGTGEFPAQRASNAENVSIWWRHHEYIKLHWLIYAEKKQSCRSRGIHRGHWFPTIWPLHQYLISHLPLNKKADGIWQMIFSTAFLWMKSFVFWLRFNWSLFLRVQLTITQHWFR